MPYNKEYYYKNRERIQLSRKSYHKAYYNKNRARLTEEARQRYAEDPEKYAEKAKRYGRKHILKDPQRYLYESAKRRAQYKNIEFTIDINDVIIPKVCPYFNTKLTLVFGKGKGEDTQNNISIDRIDNTKGYVKGNVQVISNMANKMKNDATLTQLKEFALGVIRVHS